MRTQRTIAKLFEDTKMDASSNGILAALSRAKTTIPLTTTPLPTITSASSSSASATTKEGETTAEIAASPDRFSSGGILPISVETLLPSPPPLQQMGPVEITANLNSAHNSSSSSSSNSSDAMTSSSDSSYSLSSSYADDTGLDKFMLTSELNNAHSSLAANQDSVVISDHSYFKVPDPTTNHGENEEASKRKKGRPRKYNVDSPKTQTKLTSFNSNKSTAKSDSPSASQNTTTSTADTPNSKTPTRRSSHRKYQRRNNCGKCPNCQRQDCGKCRNCLDKPKFGGRNTKKQRCIQRICIHREHYVYDPDHHKRTFDFVKTITSTSKTTPSTNKTTASTSKTTASTSKTTTSTSKTPLSYTARKRSLSQVTPSSDKSSDKATDKTTDKATGKAAGKTADKAADKSDKTIEPRPAKTPRLAITPTKLTTSTTLVSSSNSKVTMTTSEKKEYLTRTSSRRENTNKVEEETELQFLLSTAPRTLRSQLAINMALPAKIAKKEAESPRKGRSASPVVVETPPSTRKSTRSSTLAATLKSSATSKPAVSTATPTSTTVTPAQSSSSTTKGTPSKSKASGSKPAPQLSENFPNNIPADTTVIVVPSLKGAAPMEEWTVSDVIRFLNEIKYQQYCNIFEHQEIDGQALVLLEVRDMVQTLNMKLGPALKLHRIVNLLKQK